MDINITKFVNIKIIDPLHLCTAVWRFTLCVFRLVPKSYNNDILKHSRKDIDFWPNYPFYYLGLYFNLRKLYNFILQPSYELMNNTSTSQLCQHKIKVENEILTLKISCSTQCSFNAHFSSPIWKNAHSIDSKHKFKFNIILIDIALV